MRSAQARAEGAGAGSSDRQPLNDWFGVLGRWGWNEGQHESYAYTEVDQTDEIGAGASGRRWGRKFRSEAVERLVWSIGTVGMERRAARVLRIYRSGPDR